MRRTKTLWVAIVNVLLVIAPAAWADKADKDLKKPPDRYPSRVASVWFDKLYDVVKSEKTAPPPASRIYGVAAVALY